MFLQQKKTSSSKLEVNEVFAKISSSKIEVDEVFTKKK